MLAGAGPEDGCSPGSPRYSCSTGLMAGVRGVTGVVGVLGGMAAVDMPSVSTLEDESVGSSSDEGRRELRVGGSNEERPSWETTRLNDGVWLLLVA